MTEQNCEQFLTISWEEINLNKATLKPASQLKKKLLSGISYRLFFSFLEHDLPAHL